MALCLALKITAFGSTATNEAIAWDAVNKEYTAKSGELTAKFVFNLTNTAPHDVTINWVRPSCGCTAAKLPPTPWKLAPGTGGQMEFDVDLRGKHGVLSKHISVDTTAGHKLLGIKVTIPGQAAPGIDARTRNMQLAFADRQIVFRNDCAKCHVVPTIGKKGEELYATACGICHEAPHRATMVPDLTALKNTPTKEYWEHWIKNGRAGSLMPAFAQAHGGPLSNEQIQSLVEYLTHYFPPRKKVASQTPSVED
ncbi:MAG: c-type cytochrome [Verrucomicrobiales bacterium]